MFWLKPLTAFLELTGAYFMLLGRVVRKPQNMRIFRENFFREIDDIGLKTVGLISFISFFIGGVVVIQTALNLENPLIDPSLIGFAAKQSVILEFSPTLSSVILAGIVGSYISSTIGTMRITEQIDALDVMGINSANYLILPKIVAAVVFYPFLIGLSMFLGILGGWVAGVVTDLVSTQDYLEGIRIGFDPFHFTYSMIKTVVFAFLIATIPSFFGYNVKGGALEVGRASTKAVIWTSVMIVFWNYIITQLLLS
jgi:phospholipid/cholesterol/gamma-HCH transport system permease protein